MGMENPTVDELMAGLRVTKDPNDQALTRYTAVMVAAKRARQINSYYRSLGEGVGYEDLAPPLVTTVSRNHLSTAMEEITRSEVGYTLRVDH